MTEKGKQIISYLLPIIHSFFKSAHASPSPCMFISYDVDEVEVELGFFWLIKSK